MSISLYGAVTASGIGRRVFAMQPGFEGDQLLEAGHQIGEFLKARNIDEKLEYLRRHSFLLTDDGLRTLDEMKAVVHKDGDEDTVEALAAHRFIIEQVRELGFKEAARSLHARVMIQTVNDFMAGYSWMDSYVFLQKHPELLSEDALASLIAFGKRAHEQGDAQAEKVAAAHFNLLRRVEQVGAEAAFTEVGGKDFTAALRRRTR